MRNGAGIRPAEQQRRERLLGAAGRFTRGDGINEIALLGNRRCRSMPFLREAVPANSATAERMIRDNPGRPTARTQAANLMLTVSGERGPGPEGPGELPRAILRL
jgi:hypothetical protein